MTDLNLTPRLDRDPIDRYRDADHLDDARRAQQVNAPGLVPPPTRDEDSHARLIDLPTLRMAPEAFTNLALLRSPSNGGQHDACASADPVTVIVGPKRQGEELPTGIELSCTKKGGLCLTKEEAAQLQAARQAACMATAIDPFRVQVVPVQGAEIDRDRGAEAGERNMASLRNLELMAQNPFAAAAYGGARVGGATERTSQNVARVAGVVGDALLAAGVTYAGARAARAPAIAKPELLPLTPSEVELARSFLVAAGTPPKHVDKTIAGFASGVYVQTLPEDVHVFRYYGEDATPRGRWLTEQPASRPVAELALNGEQNPATKMAEWVIPRGTVVLRGPVAPLNH